MLQLVTCPGEVRRNKLDIQRAKGQCVTARGQDHLLRLVGRGQPFSQPAVIEIVGEAYARISWIERRALRVFRKQEGIGIHRSGEVIVAIFVLLRTLFPTVLARTSASLLRVAELALHRAVLPSLFGMEERQLG